MNKDKFEAEKKYQSVMAVAREMLKNGLISKQDYTIIDTNMKQKYQPFLGSI